MYYHLSGVTSPFLILTSGLQHNFLLCPNLAKLTSGFHLFPELTLARNLRSGTYSCKPELRFAIQLGITDYVFVGVVSEEMETEYKNETHYFIEGEERIHADPLTKYKIQVLTNIKGELLTDEPIELKKDGGIALDGKSIYLYPGDTLPVVGKTYIFSAFCQKNGTLIASGPNSTVEIDENNQTEAIESFKKAYEDEIVPMERERFVSLYDANRK